MKSNIQNLLKILEFTNRFQQVKRTVHVPNDIPKRFKDDAEHSFQLAMSCWYIATVEGLEYDLNKVIKYALVHDLVETYAGDIDLYMYSDKDQALHLKQQQEHAALERIQREFREFPEMIKLIMDYEMRQDEESKFVYAMDKLIGNVVTSELGGTTYKECGISQESVKQVRDQKVVKSPIVTEYFDEFFKMWDSREDYYAEFDFVPEYKQKLKAGL